VWYKVARSWVQFSTSSFLYFFNLSICPIYNMIFFHFLIATNLLKRCSVVGRIVTNLTNRRSVLGFNIHQCTSVKKNRKRRRIATNLTNRRSDLGFNAHPWRKIGIRHRIATNLTNRHSVLGCNAHSWCFLKTSRRMRHKLNSFL
jgi:hypothetical protein